MTDLTFEFSVHPELVAIARLDASAPLPEWAQGGFVTISRTPHELSVVCSQEYVPEAVQAERDKVALGVVGVIPMTTVGVLAALCGALAARSVPVFVISTYDTDYLLVSRARLDEAREALRGLGHRVVGDVT